MSTWKTYTVRRGNRTYRWHGGKWVAGGLVVPQREWTALNAALLESFDAADLQAMSRPELWEAAQVFSEMGLHREAVAALEQMRDKGDRSSGVVAQLSSGLRKLGRPDEAVNLCAAHEKHADAVLFTTYAAALCDVGRFEEARSKIARALAKSGSPEAFLVLARIRSERPDLR